MAFKPTKIGIGEGNDLALVVPTASGKGSNGKSYRGKRGDDPLAKSMAVSRKGLDVPANLASSFNMGSMVGGSEDEKASSERKSASNRASVTAAKKSTTRSKKEQGSLLNRARDQRQKKGEGKEGDVGKSRTARPSGRKSATGRASVLNKTSSRIKSSAVHARRTSMGGGAETPGVSVDGEKNMKKSQKSRQPSTRQELAERRFSDLGGSTTHDLSDDSSDGSNLSSDSESSKPLSALGPISTGDDPSDMKKSLKPSLGSMYKKDDPSDMKKSLKPSLGSMYKKSSIHEALAAADLSYSVDNTKASVFDQEIGLDSDSEDEPETKPSAPSTPREDADDADAIKEKKGRWKCTSCSHVNPPEGVSQCEVCGTNCPHYTPPEKDPRAVEGGDGMGYPNEGPKIDEDASLDKRDGKARLHAEESDVEDDSENENDDGVVAVDIMDEDNSLQSYCSSKKSRRSNRRPNTPKKPQKAKTLTMKNDKPWKCVLKCSHLYAVISCFLLTLFLLMLLGYWALIHYKYQEEDFGKWGELYGPDLTGSSDEKTSNTINYVYITSRPSPRQIQPRPPTVPAVSRDESWQNGQTNPSSPESPIKMPSAPNYSPARSVPPTIFPLNTDAIIENVAPGTAELLPQATAAPTASAAPSVAGTAIPSAIPSPSPSIRASVSPSATPSQSPSDPLSKAPSQGPSHSPTVSHVPSQIPSNHPSSSSQPSASPINPLDCPEELPYKVALGADGLLTMRFMVRAFEPGQIAPELLQHEGLLCVSLEYNGVAGWLGWALSEAPRNPSYGRKEAIIGIPGIQTADAVAVGPAALGQYNIVLEGSPAFYSPAKYTIPAGGLNGYNGPSLIFLNGGEMQTLMNPTAGIVHGGDTAQDTTTALSFAKFFREPNEITVRRGSNLVLYAVSTYESDGSFEGNPKWRYKYVDFFGIASTRMSQYEPVADEQQLPRKQSREHSLGDGAGFPKNEDYPVVAEPSFT